MRRGALLALLVVAGCPGGSGKPERDAAPGPDAPLAACGLPEPGSRCVDSTRLERCNGTQVETVDCAALGDLCGPDPSAPSADQAGAACIASGDACGWIDYYGACQGSVLVYCNGGELTVVECATSYRICEYTTPDIGFNCTTDCELAEPDATTEGICIGDSIYRCVFEDGAFHARTDACPPGFACDGHPETGNPACLPQPACSTIGPLGRCSGDLLTRCVDGSAMNYDCAAMGQVCGYGGVDRGYVCADPGEMGAFAVSGTIQYEDREPLLGSLGPLTPRAARGVSVAVVTADDDSVLAYALSADDGSYLLRYDATLGEQVYVLVATTSSLPARPVRVLRPDGLVHGFASPVFSAAAATTQDLLVTDFSGVSPAFNVFDVLVAGMDGVRAMLDDPAPPPLFAQWTRGSTDGTYYWDAVNGMFLLGEASDDDGYDDAVVLHEMGHYIEDAYGRSDSPNGPHDGTPTDPRLAWSEGFSTYFSGVVRDDPFYMDSNAAGGWYYDMESTITAANPMLPMTQVVSEDMVSEILWDVGDGGGADDDPLSAGTRHDVVLGVAPGWLRSMVAVPRGVVGIDLVDWLDGWFQLQGLATCPELRAIVASRSFPYDFNGPGGACPP